MNIEKYRRANYEIDPVYINRWSPRGFSSKHVEREKLNRLFEAARWAPSAANYQPWRFIYATSEEDRKKFLTCIHDGNVEWCKYAPVLVAVLSKKTRNEAGDPNRTHAFDTGTAWGYLSLEANRQGLITHGMGGFDRGKAKEVWKSQRNMKYKLLLRLVIMILRHHCQKKINKENFHRTAIL